LTKTLNYTEIVVWLARQLFLFFIRFWF